MPKALLALLALLSSCSGLRLDGAVDSGGRWQHMYTTTVGAVRGGASEQRSMPRLIRAEATRQHPGLGPDRKLKFAGGAACTRPGRTADLVRLAQCVPCIMRPETARQLFVKESSDGAGARLQNMIAGMALAAAHGMNFGGVVSLRVCGTLHGAPHGVDFLPLAKGVFGLEMPEQLFLDHVPMGVGMYESVHQWMLSLDDVETDDKRSVYIPTEILARQVDDAHPNVNSLMTPKFLAALRHPDTPLQKFPLDRFQYGQTSVAVHVRRGDMYVDEHSHRGDRAAPDEWYFQLLDLLKERLPDADIHIFSSLEGHHNSSEFDGYRDRGMTVHLDSEVLDTMAHLARAKVLVTAKSAFSFVPALLNTNCVLFQDWWFDPLGEWARVGDPFKCKDWASCKWEFDTAAIDSCIARVGTTTSRAEPRMLAQKAGKGGKGSTGGKDRGTERKYTDAGSPAEKDGR